MTSALNRGSEEGMVPLFLLIAVLSLLYPDRAVVVCGLLMLTTWWQRQR